MLSRHQLIRLLNTSITLISLATLSFLATLPHACSEDKPSKKVVPMLSRPELLKLFADEFVTIAPGEEKFPATFRMGSDRTDNEKPSHEVTLKHRFAIAKYEVPQNLWEAVMGSNPSKWKGPRNSVEMLSWKEAREFCRKVSELLRAEKRLGDDEVIRLPTEAE